MNEFLDNAVIYQIYPISFYDSNGDGYGDFNGITQKLDYIKDLGVNIIWLNPIYMSPFMDGGYDISDYEKVNPIFGTEDDLKALLNKAHSLGIKVISMILFRNGFNLLSVYFISQGLITLSKP